MIKKAAAACALAVGALISVAPTSVQADTTYGYVCTAQITNGTGTTTNPYGTTVFTMYTLPNCEGTYLKFMVACTSAAATACFSAYTYPLVNAAIVRAVAEDVFIEAGDFGVYGPNTLQSVTLQATP